MRELVEKLSELYASKDAIETLIAFTQVMPAASIPLGDTAKDIWRKIIEKVQVKPDIHLRICQEILKEQNLGQENKIFFKFHCEQLQIKINQFPKELETPPSYNQEVPVNTFGANAPKARPDDPKVYENNLIWNTYPFINRQSLKKALRLMLSNKTNNTLIIEGKAKSGMTHTHRYISDIIINQFDIYKLLQIGPDFKSKTATPIYKDKTDLMNEISAGLDLGYEVNRLDSSDLIKITTFFTKLKDYKSLNKKTPVICLDGIYKLGKPSIYAFVEELINEANTHKKYYVILTNTNEIEPGTVQMKAGWQFHIRNLPTVDLNSFKEKDVKDFIDCLFGIYQDKIELGENADVLYQDFIDSNVSTVHFKANRLNVLDIGEACKALYQNIKREA